MINEPAISPLFVCGIIGDSTAMVLNKSLTGPFKNRYDLVTAPVTTRATLSEAVSQIATSNRTTNCYFKATWDRPAYDSSLNNIRIASNVN
ncbi:hypothetical protein RYX41_05215 [Lactiplantibacillus plantarum]|nr:hypothetical protein [Lactiplantibacillus plantarum]